MPWREFGYRRGRPRIEPRRRWSGRQRIGLVGARPRGGDRPDEILAPRPDVVGSDQATRRREHGFAGSRNAEHFEQAAHAGERAENTETHRRRLGGDTGLVVEDLVLNVEEMARLRR